MKLIIERVGDSWECLRCLYSVSLMPDAIWHARDQHGVKYLRVEPKEGIYETEIPEANPL